MSPERLLRVRLEEGGSVHCLTPPAPRSILAGEDNAYQRREETAMVSVIYFKPGPTPPSEEEVTAVGAALVGLQGRFASVHAGPTFSLSRTTVVTGLREKRAYDKTWGSIWKELRARNLVPDPVTLCVLHESLGKAGLASDEGLVMVSEGELDDAGYAAIEHANPDLDASGPTPPGPPRYITPLDDEAVPKGAASPPQPTMFTRRKRS